MVRPPWSDIGNDLNATIYHLPFTIYQHNRQRHIERPPCHGASLREKHTNRLVPRSIDIAIGFQPLETCNLAILLTDHDLSRERFKYIPGPTSWTTLRKPWDLKPQVYCAFTLEYSHSRAVDAKLQIKSGSALSSASCRTWISFVVHRRLGLRYDSRTLMCRKACVWPSTLAIRWKLSVWSKR